MLCVASCSLWHGIFGGSGGKSADAPDWVSTGRSNRYPISSWLTGTGSADYTGDTVADGALAGNRARADMLGQLVSDVKAEFHRRASENSTGGNSVVDLQAVERIEVSVRGSIAAEPTREQFVDHDVNRVYVLLAIKRTELAAALDRRLDDMRKEQQSAVDDLGNEMKHGGHVEVLRRLPTLRAQKEQYDVIALERASLLKQQDGAAPPVTSAVLASLKRDALAGISVKIELKCAEEDAAALRPEIAAALGAAGLSCDGPAPTHRLMAELDISISREEIAGEDCTQASARWKATLEKLDGRVILLGAPDAGSPDAIVRAAAFGTDAKSSREKARGLAIGKIRAALEQYLAPPANTAGDQAHH